MAIITLKGRQIKTVGALPKIGSLAPDFTLTKIDLSELTLKQCFGKKTVLSIFPSIDTNVCATAMRHFNETAEKIPNVNVLCVSADLPFAQKRFCGAENL
jgi:thiol peroxidase